MCLKNGVMGGVVQTCQNSVILRKKRPPPHLQSTKKNNFQDEALVETRNEIFVF